MVEIALLMNVLPDLALLFVDQLPACMACACTCVSLCRLQEHSTSTQVSWRILPA